MKTFIIALLCLLGALLTSSQQQELCQNVKPIEYLDLDKFLGKWYWNLIAASTRNAGIVRCTSNEFYKKDNGTIINNYRFIWQREGNKYDLRVGNLFRCSNCQKDGRLRVSTPSRVVPVKTSFYRPLVFRTPLKYKEPYELRLYEADFIVLDTDYENFTAVYACWFAPDGALRHWAVGLCRQKVCPEKYKEIIIKTFEKNGVDLKALQILNQENCPEV